MTPFATNAIDRIDDVPGLYISEYKHSGQLPRTTINNLASITIPRSLSLLREHGITHVLSLNDRNRCPEIGAGMGIQHISVEIGDNPLEDLLMCLEGLCAWIGHSLNPSTAYIGLNGGEAARDVGPPYTIQTGDASPDAMGYRTAQGCIYDLATVHSPKVLVHCSQGISRSGAVITAYLMKTLSLDYDSALSRAQKYRPIVMPNSGFADQLRLWGQLQHCIFTHNIGGKATTKSRYENWKADRGVLLKKSELERQQVSMERMREMAERCRPGKVELEGK